MKKEFPELNKIWLKNNPFKIKDTLLHISSYSYRLNSDKDFDLIDGRIYFFMREYIK